MAICSIYSQCFQDTLASTHFLIWQIWPVPEILMVIPKLISVHLKPIFANYFNKRRKILGRVCIDYMKGNRLLHWKQTYFLLCLFQSRACWHCLCPWSIPSPLHSTPFLRPVFFGLLWLWLLGADWAVEEKQEKPECFFPPSFIRKCFLTVVITCLVSTSLSIPYHNQNSTLHSGFANTAPLPNKEVVGLQATVNLWVTSLFGFSALSSLV